jgi:hypothetical protein
MSRAQTEAGIQELYIGILGRAADYAGLKYWADAIEGGARTLEDTRASFASPNQPEYWSIYGGLSSGALVDKVYQNFLERSPDAAGKAYWISELDSGKIGADFFVSAITNAAKDPKSTDPQTLTDAKVLANKVESAQYFTTKTKDANWGVDDFTSHSKAAVDSVNSDPSSLASAKTATDTYIASLPPGPSTYNDKLADASDSILSPTQIALNTSVDGVLGLRYSPTHTDNIDYFTLTVQKTGILKLAQFGDRKIDLSVIAGTTHIMDNSAEQYQQSEAWIGYQGAAQVFAGEQVVIQLTGSGAPTPGSGAAATDGLEYGFRFYMDS